MGGRGCTADQRRPSVNDRSGNTITLVLGGVRSGKSRVAGDLALHSSAPVAVVATGVASDAEMRTRIAAHRRDRPESWRVIEEPADLASAVDTIERGTVLLDSIDSWLGNLMHAAGCFEPEWQQADTAVSMSAAEDGVKQVLSITRDRRLSLIAVSCEAGLGTVGATAPTRAFIDMLGHVNQLLAAAADRALLVVAGRCIEL